MNQKPDSEAIPQPFTGIPGIDGQHKELMNQITVLLDHLGGKDPSVEVVYNSLQKIAECYKTHFATEESLMKMIGFPGIENHKKQHAKINKQVADAAATLKKSENLKIINTINAIREAEEEHTSVYDIEYASHIETLMALRKQYNITAVKAQVLTK